MPPKYVWYRDPLMTKSTDALMRYKLEVTYMN